MQTCQPFGSKSDTDAGRLLELLRDINNADKHRLIPVVATIAKLDALQGKQGCFAGIEMSADCHIVIKRDGFVSSFEGLGNGVLSEGATVLARLKLDPRFDMTMEPKISAVVQFGKGAPGFEDLYVMPTVGHILRGVYCVIAQLFPHNAARP